MQSKSSNGYKGCFPKKKPLTCYSTKAVHLLLAFFDDIHNQTLSVDSTEEVDTLNWLSEACKLSVINDFSY